MNKYLEKIANMREEDKTSSPVSGVLLGAAGLGTAAHGYSTGGITGRRTVYHGTSHAAAASIREQGLKPKGGHGPTAFVRGVESEANKLEANHVFTTPHKQYAESMSRFTEGAASGRFQWDKEKGNVPGHDYHDYAFNKKNPKGSVLKMSLPVDEFKPTQNPAGHLMGGGAFETVFKGSIPPEYIHGSKSYKKHSIGEFAKYVKKNPGRFSSAVAVPAALLAGSAYAFKKKSREEADGTGSAVALGAAAGAVPGLVASAKVEEKTKSMKNKYLGKLDQRYDDLTKHRFDIKGDLLDAEYSRNRHDIKNAFTKGYSSEGMNPHNEKVDRLRRRLNSVDSSIDKLEALTDRRAGRIRRVSNAAGVKATGKIFKGMAIGAGAAALAHQVLNKKKDNE